MTDLEVIADVLTLSEDEASIVLQLCQWADHEVAIALHGYPKDNLIPPPMRERLGDADYVGRLERLAAEDEDVNAPVWEALQKHLRTLAQSQPEQ